MNSQDEMWRDAAVANFMLAGHLIAAALSLELACTAIDDRGDRLYAELAEILPADDMSRGGFENDRDFLLDRAQSHRKVASTCAGNGAILAQVLAESLRERTTEVEPWSSREEIQAMMAPYAQAVTNAANEAERLLGALAGSTSEMGNEEPARITAGIVRFLNLESALLSALVEDRPDF